MQCILLSRDALAYVAIPSLRLSSPSQVFVCSFIQSVFRHTAVRIVRRGRIRFFAVLLSMVMPPNSSELFFGMDQNLMRNREDQDPLVGHDHFARSLRD